MTRMLVALTLAFTLGACGGGGGESNTPPEPLDPGTTLQRASAWLWAQQGADGAWHSDTYGLMRSGQSLTPFVLYALLKVPEGAAPKPKGGVKRALEFIRRHTNEKGCLGRSDPDIADYPNHATAYAVRCLVAAGDAGDRKLIQLMCAYLLAQQFNTGRGIQPAAARWGGWGFGSQGRPGIMDIGHTRHVLEALRDAKALDAATAARAESFLRLTQRHPDEKRPQPRVPGEPAGQASRTYDGGFYFSPVDTGMNKGRFEAATDGLGAWFRSYATATCDGLLSLLAAGVPLADERVRAAKQWLDRHPGLQRPAGVPTDDPTPWYAAIHYYHLAVRAEAWAATGRKGDWRAEFERRLAALQRKDGSFLNQESPMMKENDPILCTALAVVALGGLA